MGYRPKRVSQRRQLKEMFNILSYQGNVDQKYFEIPSYTYQNDEDQLIQVTAHVGEDEN